MWKLLFATGALLSSIALSLFLTEFALRSFASRGSSAPDYGDVHSKELGPGGQLIPGQDLGVADGLGGLVRWRSNRAGFRNDREFEPVPLPETRRVLSIGDSFAAGYRVGQEDFYPAILEQLANRELGPTEVLAASAEEPLAALHYLRSYGLQYKPDLVVL